MAATAIRNHSLATLLVASACGLLAASLLLVTGIGHREVARNAFALLGERSQVAVTAAEAHLIDGETRPVEAQARWIARAFERGEIDWSREAAMLQFARGALAATPSVVALALLRPDGTGFRVARGPAPAESVDWSDDPAVSEAMARARRFTAPTWDAPVWVPHLGEPVLNLRTPLRRDGEFVGGLVQAKRVSDVSRRLQALFSDDKGVAFVLYGPDRVLAHPGLVGLLRHPGSEADPLPHLEGFQDAVLAEYAGARPVDVSRYGAGASFRAAVATLGHHEYVYLTREVSGVTDRPVTVGVYFDTEQAGAVFAGAGRVIGAGLAVLAAAALLAWYLARRAARPVTALARASERVAAGDLDQVPALPPTRLRELAVAGEAFGRMVDGLRERERIRDLFGRVVPRDVAERMLQSPEALEPQETEATILFVDLAGFTRMTEQLGGREVVEVLNAYFDAAAEIIARHGGIITQFQGDAILGVFNVPAPDPEHAEHALAAGTALRALLLERDFAGRHLTARIGINTGTVIAGNVGAARRMNYTVHGDAVNLAARIEQMNKEHGTALLLSGETARRVEGVALRKVGTARVRGRDATVDLYATAGDA